MAAPQGRPRLAPLRPRCFGGGVSSGPWSCPLCGAPTPSGVCPTHGVTGRATGPIDPTRIFVPGASLGGRYRIDAIIATAGPRVTLRATGAGGRPVIVETLGIERLARRAPLLDSLFRESGVPTLFERPYLVEIIDFGVEPMTQNPFLVMALSAGRDLREVPKPGSPEKQTAAAFIEVCHGLLDSHDGEILRPANAMPTMVPGAATEVPVPAAPTPPGSTPARSPALSSAQRGRASADGGPSSEIGGGHGWKLLVLACGLALGLYWYLPNPSLNAPYYNPNIKSPTILWERGPLRDPRDYQAAVGADMIKIESDPPAEVWSGTTVVGQTPVEVPRPTGGDRVRFVLKREGYLDKAVTVHRDSKPMQLELHAKADAPQRDRFVGEREKEKGLLDGNPFDPEDDAKRFGEDPRTQTPFLNPFDAPGTAPSLEDYEDEYNPYGEE